MSARFFTNHLLQVLLGVFNHLLQVGSLTPELFRRIHKFIGILLRYMSLSLQKKMTSLAESFLFSRTIKQQTTVIRHLRIDWQENGLISVQVL
jgi:hypothetical protein